jgi:hypothetical protein
MESTARRAESGVLAWGAWYRSRFLRLYPMYWVAHLVYLVSPFVVRPEQVDGRIVLSLLGLRFVDIEMNFYYLNPAWWYFSMLIQFYLLFPLLFWAARRLGPWTFLLTACAVGFLARYLMLVVYPQNGMWIQGGFAVCRLPEFALGMVTLTSSSISPPAHVACSEWSARPESLCDSKARQRRSASSERSPMACIWCINLMLSGWAFASGSSRSGCFFLSPPQPSPCSARGESSWRKRLTRFSTN